MKKLLTFFLTALLTFSVGWATEVTFNASTDKGNVTANGTTANGDHVTKDGVTVTSSNGPMGNGSNYRVYQNGTLTVTSTVGNITKIEMTFTASGTNSYGPSKISATGYSYSGSVGTWQGTAASSVTLNATAQVRITQIVVTVTGGATVVSPTISPNGGNFGSSQVVTLSHDDADVAIYYTTNGAEPTTSSTLYTSPFTIYETTTVKAIAVKNGVSSSPATATFNEVGVGSIATAYALAQGSQFVFTGNAVVTYQNGPNIWIRDNSGSGMIYGYNLGNYVNGDILDAGWSATNTTYQQVIRQFGSASGLSSSSNDGTVAPVDKTSTGVTNANIHEYVSFSHFTTTWDSSVGYRYITIDNHNIYLKDQFSQGFTFTNGKYYDIEGIVYIDTQNNNNTIVYLTKVTEVTTTNPQLTVSPDELTINDSGTGNTFTVEGSNLGGDNVGLTQNGSYFTPTLTATTGWATNGGSFWYFSPNNGSLNGTVAMSYTGRDLSASETVTLANNLASATVAVNYRSDVYILGNYGSGWDYSNGILMTYNNGTYTASVTASEGNLIVFARKLGLSESSFWNTRYAFGPNSTGDCWVSGDFTGTIDLNDDDPIYFNSAGTYVIEINATTGALTITKEVVNTGDFELVTNVSDLVAGNEVIIVSSGSTGPAEAMSTTQNSNNRGVTDVAVSATNKVTATATTQIFTLEGSSAGWYFKTVNGDNQGYIYAASSGSNYLRTETTADDNAKATISLANDGEATIIFQGSNTRNNLRYNSSNTPHIYSCYGSTSTTAKPFIYQRAASTEPEITVNPTSMELVIPAGGSSQSGTATVTETNTTGTTSVSINGDTNIFCASLNNSTLTVTYTGSATQANPDQATITLTNGTATATVTVTGYKLPMTLTITPADGHTFQGSTVTGIIESNVADATIEYSFDGTNWQTYDPNDGFTTPEVSSVGGTVTVYARATYNGETANAQATYTRIAQSATCTADIVFAPKSNNGEMSQWSTFVTHIGEGANYLSSGTVSKLWTATGYGDGAMRFGSGNYTGELAMTLDLSKFEGGACKLSRVIINAARYGSDGNNCELKVSTNVNTTGVTLPITNDQTSFADYVFNFNGDEITSLTIENTSTSNGRVYVHSISLEYSCGASVEVPVISPASGNYAEDQEVSISCGTTGATIYYTINEGETQTYSEPFNVDVDEEHTSTTIVAWAVKDDVTSESATVTYIYKNLYVNSIEEFLALAEGDSAYFKNPVVVLFDYSQNSSNGQEYIWVKDRTGYTQFFIAPQFDADSVADPQYNGNYNRFWPKYENGDVIPAGFKVKKAHYSTGDYYQGQCYATHSSFQAATDKALADPEQVTLSELLANPAAYNNRYLFINKMQVDYSGTGLSFTISADENGDDVSEVQGGTAIVGYNKYNSPAWKNKQGVEIGVTVPEDNNFYNVKFIFQKWSQGYEIMPIEFIPWKADSVRLDVLVKVGVENDTYTISNQLQAAKVTWDADRNMFAIFAKDDEMYDNKRYPAAGQETYLIRYENGTFINEVEQEDYDQSNWIEILIPSGITNKTAVDINVYNDTLHALQGMYENQILKAGSIHGTYVDALNPTIQVTKRPIVVSALTYEPNIYCTANFLMENLDTNGAQGNDGNYFMMDAKPHEFCKVVWCWYDHANGNYFVIPAREGNVVNGHDFHGSFKANMSLCEDYRVNNNFDVISTWFLDSDDESYHGQQTLYGFDAIVRKNPNYSNPANGAPRRIQEGTGDIEPTPAYIVYPLNAGDNSSDNVVSVKEVLGNKAIESVHYYNMMGMEGKTPFEGINIVVTRFTDGSTSTYKVMK